MRALVRALHEETKVTTVFVTHDQAEAVEVADSSTLLVDGKLAGNGPPEAFYTAPPSLAAARFFGVTNELAGRVSAGTFRGLGCRLCTPRWIGRRRRHRRAGASSPPPAACTVVSTAQ